LSPVPDIRLPPPEFSRPISELRREVGKHLVAIGDGQHRAKRGRWQARRRWKRGKSVHSGTT